MSNKMKKFIFVSVILIVFISELFGFFPKRNNFNSEYQYTMFRSWIKKNKIRKGGVASFKKQYIETNFNNKRVLFLWKRGKIYAQAELIDSPNILIKNKLYLLAAEALYRINCKDTFYFYDFIDKHQSKVYYGKFHKDKAIYQFFLKYENQLFEPNRIIVNNNIVMFKMQTDTLKILFPEIKTFVTYSLPPQKKAKKKKAVIEKEIKFQSSSKLENFILKNHKKIFPLEILNNKISSPERFIKNNFSGYKIHKKRNIFHIDLQSFENRFYANLDVMVQKKETSIKFIPLNDFKYKNKKMVFRWGEKIDLSALNQTEAKQISYSIPHLLYEHRSLGTKLFNFLLINDAVPSTLVLKTKKGKKLIEFESYSSLLKLLNDYFEGSKSYFTITKVKKVNGNIELFANLLIKKNNDLTFAEVRFQLEKNYQMKYIMMFLNI